MQRHHRTIAVERRCIGSLQKEQAEWRGVRLNALVDSVRGIAVKFRSVGVELDIPVERHVVVTSRCVRIRIAERPSIIPAVANASELFRRKIVDVRLHELAVIIGSIAAPIAVEGIGDVVAVIDDDPQRVRTRNYCQPFCVAQPPREQPALGAVGVVHIHGSTNGIALCIGQTDVACGCDGDVQFIGRIDRDVLQLVAIASAKLWRARARQTRNDNLASLSYGIAARVSVPGDLVSFSDVDIRRGADRYVVVPIVWKTMSCGLLNPDAQVDVTGSPPAAPG